MALIISKVCRWTTSDGVEHPTHEMAVHHVLNAELIEIIGDVHARQCDAQDVLNALSDKSARGRLREWLDSCDAMEKASLL